MITKNSDSLLVILIGADGHPVAVRNTEVLAVDRWQVWIDIGRLKEWVYDDVVCIVVPTRKELNRIVQKKDESSGNTAMVWEWIPVKGPLEEVVFALNQGCHMFKQSTALP